MLSMKQSLEHRPLAEERMDSLVLSKNEMLGVEQALNRINYLSGNFFRIAHWLRDEYRKKNSAEFSFADIGCGGGGLLRYLESYARRNNFKVKFYGIDLNETLISIANSYNTKEESINYSRNCLEQTDSTYSLINTNLVLHHLLPEEIQAFLKLTKERATVGTRHEDLLRSRRGLYLASIFPKLVTKSAVVHHDAKVSVYRSYSREQWKLMANESGYEFKAIFPERALLTTKVK